MAESENKKQRRSRFFWFRELLDGSILTKQFVVKQLPFILYLVFFAIIYIGNRYNAEKVVKEINKRQREIKELRSESITLSSDLMYMRRETEIINLINKKQLDLAPAKRPAFKIVVRDSEEQ